MLRLNKKNLVLLVLFFELQRIFSLQFGNGNDESSRKFIKVADDVKDFSIGLFTTYIIKNDDSLWGTGYVDRSFHDSDYTTNSFEEFDNDISYFDGRYLIKKDGSIFKVKNEITKFDYKIKKSSGCFFITEDNCLWVYGDNPNGSFGVGKDEVFYNKPTKIRNDVIDVCYSYLFSLIITKNHDLMISGKHYLPAPYQKTNKFEKIADNVRFTIKNFYITDNDELYVFGWAAYGITGLGDLGKQWKIKPTKVMNDVKSVACNDQATLILKKDGTLYGCGGDSPNYCGELGFGNFDPVFSPEYIMNDVKKVDMESTWSIVLKNDDTLWMCGSNNDWEGGL